MISELFLSDLSLWRCLWQSTVFIALGILLSYSLRNRPARGYQILLFAMIAAALVPFISAAVKHYNLGILPRSMTVLTEERPFSAKIEQERVISDTAVPTVTTQTPVNPLSTKATSKHIPASWHTIALYSWIATTLILLARLAVTFIYGANLVENSSRSGCEKIQGVVYDVILKLRLFCDLQVRCSGRIHSPIVWCWTNPSILLVPNVSDDAGADWSGVVAHELAHSKRWDHVTGLVAELMVCLLPWNPLMWLSKKYLVRLGEQACDDWVVASGQSSEDYAESLLHFRPQKQMAFVPAVVHSKKGLAGRIDRILKDSCGNPRTGAKWAFEAGFAILCLVLGVAFAQNQSGSAIDEVSTDPQSSPLEKLHQAASAGDVQREQVRSLIAGGADINARDKNGRTALHSAVSSYTQSIGVVELLIEKNANVNAEDNNGRTPIDIAMDRNRHKTFALLMSTGGNVSVHTAAFAGDIQAVNNLIENDVNINAKDANGKTPLHYAAGRGHLHVIKSLLDNGANVDSKDKNGDTALHHAARSGNKETITFFLERGADPNSRNDNGNTPVEVHISQRPARGIVDLFLQNGADTSSIYLATYLGDLNTVKNLIEANKNAATSSVDGFTPLHTAAWAGNKSVAAFLINNGANVNARAQAELTPLAYAAIGGHEDIVNLLIDRGANLKTDYTGVECAVMGRQNEILKIILSAGTDSKLLGDTGNLHLAGMMNNLEAARLLIRHGVDIDAKWLNRTALYHSVTDGRVEFCKFLIAEGADINAKAPGDWTPLHAACAYNLKDKVELFLSAGADVNARNIDGKTPMELASERGHTGIVELLRKHGARDDLSRVPTNANPIKSL